MKNSAILMAYAIITLASCTQTPRTVKCDGYNLIIQDGPMLGYSPSSGISIIYKDNLAFKDLNHNNSLDPYEDWRLSIAQRSADLASQLSDEEIAGLMLYSSHQAIPNSHGYTPSTWNGMSYEESGAKPWDLSDQQKKFLTEDNLRHVLITTVQSADIAARWNNTAQAFVEGLGHGIPNNNSSDPRHSADNDSEFNAGGGGAISMWPNELGMGATFDPTLMHQFGEIASTEYRALGFTTSLSPQIDIATEPRWMRFSGTYSEDPDLVTDMAQAYCDAFQTSAGKEALYGSWGLKSVNTMAKHWPGGGPGEAGRDAHFGRGKYAVYPCNKIALHKQSFIKGALSLAEGTDRAAAIMPYYTISVGQSDEMVANNFNYDIITRQLRDSLGYDGVICTDWAVTADVSHPGIHGGKPWGVEELTVAERHYKALMAGVDQFGGNDDKQPILEAFKMMSNHMGRQSMRQRIEASARRLLINIFRTGLFENPYLDPEESAHIVGNPEFMNAGYQAQLRSVIMLKNHGKTLPLPANKTVKVYIPQRIMPRHVNFWGGYINEELITPVKEQMASNYFDTVTSASDADVAIVFIDSPQSGYGYKASETLPAETDLPEDDIYFMPSNTDIPCPGNGYYPISLQYSDYIATEARAQSIAGGDPYEKTDDRSYKGKGIRTINKGDMELVQRTRSQMAGKKVVVVMNCSNPAVMSEIEPYCDALIVRFGIQVQAVLDIITGRHEPSALLPFQMPADMATVEHQAEDTPRDMQCYKDSDGNIYDFGFGLNWSGVINDWRTEKYR